LGERDDSFLDAFACASDLYDPSLALRALKTPDLSEAKVRVHCELRPVIGGLESFLWQTACTAQANYPVMAL